MDSWDDDEFEVPSVEQVTQKETSAVTWEDEEEEEEEEEEVPQETSGNATPPKGPLKPKQLKKLKMKEIEEKRNMEIAITKARLAEQANETAAERKAREQRSIEEADYEAAIDAFTPAPAAGAASVSDIESAISNLRLATLSEHEQLGELVASKLIPSNSKYALECIKIIVTKGSVNLTADDMKDLNTVINIIKNEKIAAAKPKGKKKKVTGKAGYANVERGGVGAGLDEDYAAYDDDYDDFM